MRRILASIREQGKLTPELEAQLLAAETLTALEDLYQPYRPKRRTRASIARERGLQPLADLILAQPRQGDGPETAAQGFLSDDVPTVDDALAGARDIVAETISDHAEVRRQTREKAMRFATFTATRIDGSADDKGVYSLYYDYSSRIDRLKPYQVLAINRGEAQKVLRVSVDIPERDWQQAIRSVFPDHPLSPWAEQLKQAADDSAKRLLLPAIERDVRRHADREGRQPRHSGLCRQPARPAHASRRWPATPCWASTPASAPAARSPSSTRPARCWTPAPSTRTRRRSSSANRWRRWPNWCSDMASRSSPSATAPPRARRSNWSPS